MLKVSAFYLKIQKSFIPKKKILSRTAKIDPKDGVSRLNFPEGFAIDVTMMHPYVISKQEKKSYGKCNVDAVNVNLKINCINQGLNECMKRN